MEEETPKFGKLYKLWEGAVARLSRDKQAGKPTKPDKREYTLMLIPHQGEAVVKVRIPIKVIKYSVATVCVVTIFMTGAIINYRHTVKTANADKTELQRLREVTSDQYTQIEQLASKTAKLQEDMTRLNALDSEIRKILSSDDLAASRSGTVRPTGRNDGQGGPGVKPQITEIGAVLDNLQNAAVVREKSLSGLKEAIVERNARLAVTPSIWPANGDVTSRFGWRSSPWGIGSDWHPGIDVANDYGTPIMATADGEVVYSGWIGGYGKAVEIRHGYGISTLYGHNSENLVSVGQYVKKGQTIAYMGSTGISTGPHVHYEVRVNETAVNPANFL